MPFAGGDGSSSNPYQIETWEHLDSVRNNLSSYFVLNNTLDSNTSGYDTYASSNANSGSGWNPIGDSNNEFTGELDGQGNEINDFYIDRPSTDRVGLFAGTSSGALIKEVGFTNFNIVNAASNAGGAVGYNDAQILYSYAKGEVKISGISSNAGVLAGYNASEVQSCFSHGRAEAEYAAGGLTGINGGLGAITTSYTTAVAVAENAGGAVGVSYGDEDDSYSTGPPSGNTTGGFIGNLQGGSTTDCYWDVDSSNQSSSPSGTGLSTSQMQGDSASNNMSFDFSNIWEEVLASDGDVSEDKYPILQGSLDGYPSRSSQLEQDYYWHFNPDETLAASTVFNTESSFYRGFQSNFSLMSAESSMLSRAVVEGLNLSESLIRGLAPAEVLALSATVSTNKAQLTGKVVLGALGQPLQGVEVYAVRESDREFLGYDITDVNGDYSISIGPATSGDVILVGADYYDSGNDRYFGEEKSINYE